MFNFVKLFKIMFYLIAISYFVNIHAAYFSLFQRNHKITRQVTERTVADSLITCALYCTAATNCTAISYNKSTGECILVDLCLYFYVPDDFSHSGYIVMQKAMEGICPGYTIVTAIGGDGGTYFSDYWSYYDVQSQTTSIITALKLSCTNYVALIQIQYGGIWASPRGKTFNGDVRTYTFDVDEVIVSVFGDTKGLVDALQINTNKRSLPQCGSSPSLKLLSYGDKLGFIAGQTGWVLDQVLWYWE